jgi:hypothetical protein
MTTPEDLDETARIILMDDPPPTSITQFRNRLRDEHPTATLLEIAELWRMYRGWDTRPATHDIETGKPKT